MIGEFPLLAACRPTFRSSRTPVNFCSAVAELAAMWQNTGECAFIFDPIKLKRLMVR
jgi:hypothetical protein